MLAKLFWVRAGALAKLKDDGSRAEVVRRAVVLETRLGALDKIRDRKVLLDLATNVAEKRIALGALDRMGRFAPLDVVAKRAKNKQVAKEAQTAASRRLLKRRRGEKPKTSTEVTEAQMRYARRSQMVREAEAFLEKASKAAPEDKTFIMEMEAEWQTLEPEGGDALSRRFHKAVDRFFRAFQDAVEKERERERIQAQAEADAALKKQAERDKAASQITARETVAGGDDVANEEGGADGSADAASEENAEGEKARGARKAGFDRGPERGPDDRGCRGGGWVCEGGRRGPCRAGCWSS